MCPSLGFDEAFGYSETFRRFVQREGFEPQANEIPNTMPSWMPGEDYYTNFRKGDPYIKVDQGFAPPARRRLCHAHPELKDVNPEDYPDIHKMAILADIAPYSREYNTFRQKVGKEAQGNTELEIEYLRILDRVRQTRSLRTAAHEKPRARASKLAHFLSTTEIFRVAFSRDQGVVPVASLVSPSWLTQNTRTRGPAKGHRLGTRLGLLPADQRPLIHLASIGKRAGSVFEAESLRSPALSVLALSLKGIRLFWPAQRPFHMLRQRAKWPVFGLKLTALILQAKTGVHVFPKFDKALGYRFLTLQTPNGSL